MNVERLRSRLQCICTWLQCFPTYWRGHSRPPATSLPMIKIHSQTETGSDTGAYALCQKAMPNSPLDVARKLQQQRKRVCQDGRRPRQQQPVYPAIHGGAAGFPGTTGYRLPVVGATSRGARVRVVRAEIALFYLINTWCAPQCCRGGDDGVCRCALHRPLADARAHAKNRGSSTGGACTSQQTPVGQPLCHRRKRGSCSASSLCRTRLWAVQPTPRH